MLHKITSPALPIRAAATLLFVAMLLWSAAAPRIFATKKVPPSTPVNINEATLKELEEVPGIGPTTAKAIIQFRTRSGRFRRVNDLLVIRGVSEGKLAKMRPYVTVGTAPAAPAPSATKKPPSPQPHAASTSASATPATKQPAPKPAQPKSSAPSQPAPPAQPTPQQSPPSNP